MPVLEAASRPVLFGSFGSAQKDVVSHYRFETSSRSSFARQTNHAQRDVVVCCCTLDYQAEIWVVNHYHIETSSQSSTASYNVRKEVLKCSFLAICKLLFLL
jgi:hypothetical protein